MAEIRPHITIGRHNDYGIVAAASHESPAAEHMLRQVGFERLPDSDLYALTEPRRDPIHRAQRAVHSLRAARYSVTSDAAYDLPSPTGQTSGPSCSDHLKGTLVPEPSALERGAFAAARALDADIQAARIVVHDQVRDPEGTLRAVGTDMHTREGVLLHGEGRLRYVEARLATTDLAFDAFSYVRGNGRPDPTPATAQHRAQAAASISPARARASPPLRPGSDINDRLPAAASRQAVRTR
ncbi:hypothetical protein ACQB60_07245 [Actinomycetota bacterium Odt1-20B]